MYTFAFILLLLCTVLCFVLVGYCAIILNELREARDTQAALSRQIADLRSDICALHRLAAGIDSALADFIEEMTAPLPDEEPAEQGERENEECPHVTFAEGGGHD